ncbi:MAG TPA: glycosyltransferase [Lachnospiraceae bacterium]|nr:glycosyltransferase [Lachnospiraceae bacterium]
MNFTVSIVVPVYNVETYLRECIDSLLCQSYKNIEIILIDDGSADASGNICDEYADKYDNITVVHKRNEGLGYARNTGMEAAKGKYVVFVDSDDYAESDMIEKLILPIIEDGADTCLGGFKRVDNHGKVLYTQTYEQQLFENENVYFSLFARMLGSSPSKHDVIKMSVWNAIYSLDIIKANDLRFPSERKLISEDLVFHSDYLKYAKKVFVLETTAYNYRVSAGSLTNSYRENKIGMICNLYVEMEKRVLEGFKIPEHAVIRLQKMFFVNIRGCIVQERKSISHKGFEARATAIRDICRNDVVRRVINEYPVKELQWRQRAMIFLMNHKMAFTLGFISGLGLM